MTTPEQNLISCIDQLASFHFTAKRFSETLHAEDKITSGHRAILKEIEAAGSRTVPQMAERRGLSPQAIQRPVDELYRRGLLEKMVNPEDRRIRKLSLTPSGEALLETIQTREFQELSLLQNGLSPEEIITVTKAVSTLTGLMSNRIRKLHDEK